MIKLKVIGIAFSMYMLVIVSTGCAIKFHDQNDVVHLIGIGHMKMKVPDAKEGVQAVMYGTETIGLAAGKTASDSHISVGWHKIEQLNVIDENTSIRLERPDSSFFTIEVGTEPPNTSNQKKQEES